MIFDTIENLKSYRGLHEKLDYAIDVIMEGRISLDGSGRVEISDSDLFYFVQKYVSKDESQVDLETHEKYIDIQWMIQGKEYIGYANVEKVKPKTEYNDVDDIQFHEGDYDMLLLNAGSFAVFFPQDAHKPCIQCNAPEDIKKIVVKIPV